jgi:hypothetical protein
MGAGEIVQDLRHLLTPRVVIAALCRRMALSENHRDQGRLSSFYARLSAFDQTPILPDTGSVS